MDATQNFHIQNYTRFFKQLALKKQTSIHNTNFFAPVLSLVCIYRNYLTTYFTMFSSYSNSKCFTLSESTNWLDTLYLPRSIMPLGASL